MILPFEKYRFPSPKDARAENKEGPSPHADY